VIGILALGLLIGLRHAFEADHLAAVASLATRSRSWREAALLGAAWGLGHTLTLLLVGGTGLLLGRRLPASAAWWLELAVGLMLLGLGADVVRRARRQRLHVHVHDHDDGTRHWHAHRHSPEPGADAHEHAHGVLPARAVAVGLVHGMAGSAALLLLTLETTGSVGLGLAYIALFGLGSVIGMALLSLVVTLPLRAGANRLARLHGKLELLLGSLTVFVGLQVLYKLLR
jgi:ABC-type nickel/cobalt efflux system permease component RcnA